MKIWVNTIVCNEENFIWFALMSVVDFVDKILIYDTGSIDKTVEIIKEIQKTKGEKIEFKEIGQVDKHQFTKARQEMLDKSDCDWILIVDGDEIWWEDSVKRLVKKIKNTNKGSIFVPVIIPVGDIYHLQDESAGRYTIKGRVGHYNLRAISKNIPGLHVDLPYGTEGYFDKNNVSIHEREDCIFLNYPYFHATLLKRSSKKNDKFKYELGKKVGEDFKYPEVLYLPFPKIVPSPWKKISGVALIKSQILTPFRKIKRRIIS